MWEPLLLVERSGAEQSGVEGVVEGKGKEGKIEVV